jgi:hypothetical protein
MRSANWAGCLNEITPRAGCQRGQPEASLQLPEAVLVGLGAVATLNETVFQQLLARCQLLAAEANGNFKMNHYQKVRMKGI